MKKKAIVKHKTVGRPTIITKSVVQKLVQAFKIGCKDELACQYAGIGERTYYQHLEKNDDFRREIVAAKNYPRIAAGSVVMADIIKGRKVSTAMWWLERRHKDEFGSGATAVQNNLNIFSFSAEERDTFNEQFREFLRRRDYA